MSDLSAAIDILIEQIEAIPLAQRNVGINMIRRRLEEFEWPKQKPSEPAAVVVNPMSPREAVEFGNQTVSFGSFKGCSYCEVPREYLDWLVEAKRNEWRTLLSYLRALEQA